MASKSIKAMLVDADILGKKIANDLKVSPTAVSRVVNRKMKSRRIQKAIADALGKPFETLWGRRAL
jgi:lambda repressor-like predicted transcriptional regulator